MNRTAPSLHATIKLHKPNTPIRPIINWKNAPAYKLEKQLTKTPHNYLNLPYMYNVRITIHCKDKRLEFSIHRKPTDWYYKSSCHPYEHKLSGIKYLLNRLNTYPTRRKSKQIGKNNIKILQKNEYNTHLLEKPLSQPQKQNIHEDPKHHKTKWATFTYCGKEDK
jgi:hypothetical protein